MRSAPVIRARILSYLYYGLKRFGMHTVVDIIPLLLHASLFLFFAGLVAFLLPINLPIAALAATILVAVVVVYVLLTLLPLIYLDCPYRTPLSAACWRISQTCMSVWHRWHSAGEKASDVVESSNQTIIEAISNRATAESPTRSARDYRALVWTAMSLSDDTELEPFVEALPDVLWGPIFRRDGYEEHIWRLVRHPDLQLQSRIAGLIDSCDSGLLSPEASKRRRITCYKALWAICGLQPPYGSSHYPEALDFTQLISHMEFHSLQPPEALHYHASALALMRWRTFCSARSSLNILANYLAQCNVDVQRGVAVDLHGVIMYLKSLPRWTFSTTGRLYEFDAVVDPASEIIPELLRAIDQLNVQTPYAIWFQYIRDAAKLDAQPYRWHKTRNAISIDAAPFATFDDILAPLLTEVVHHRNFIGPAAVSNDWNDTCVRELCAFWRPNKPVPIPYGILDYLIKLDSDEALQEFLVETLIDIHLCSCFPVTLSRGPCGLRPSGRHRLDPDFAVNAAIWRLASVTLDKGGRVQHDLSPALSEPLLKALQIVTNFEQVAFSSIAMIKSILLGSLLGCHPPPRVPPLRHPLLPTDAANPAPPEFLDAEVLAWPHTCEPFQQVLYNRIVEAKIALIAEFLEGFRFDFIPYKGTDTLRRICGDVPAPQAEIHATHQVRFANGIHHLVQMLGRDNSNDKEKLDAIFDSQMFEEYFDAGRKPHEGRSSSARAWLQDSSARVQIRDTLVEYYSNELTLAAMPPRIRGILDGLQYLHDVAVE
jgi:hypothetical protein